MEMSCRHIDAKQWVVRSMRHRLLGAFVVVLLGTKLPHGDNEDFILSLSCEQEQRVHPFGQTGCLSRAIAPLEGAWGKFPLAFDDNICVILRGFSQQQHLQ